MRHTASENPAPRRRPARGALLPGCALVLSAWVALAGLSADARAQSGGPSVKSITATLGSSGARKECIALGSRQRLRYWYRADSPINFTIEYVTDKDTLYPVKKDKTAIGSGTFLPKLPQEYCMVWTNLASHPVNLSFEFARVEN